MDDDDAELLNLDRSISDAQRHSRMTRDHLRLAVAEFGGDGVVAGDLLATLEEFGRDDLARRLAEKAHSFGLTANLSGDAVDRLTDTVEHTHQAEADHAMLVAARESILCRRDPDRSRRYVFDGRECVLDVANRRLHFLDEDKDVALTVERVEPSGTPDRTLEELQLTKGRHRKRDRDF